MSRQPGPGVAEGGAEAPTATLSASGQKQKRRAICERCCRPEKICLCPALPSTPIEFKRCQVIVLQHPHECRRKNRSMPLINLCVAGAADDEEALSWGRKAAKKKKKKKARTTAPPVDDFHIRTIVHRRLGDEVEPEIMAIINDLNRDILLLFPSDDAVSLDEGMNEIERRRKEREEKSGNRNAGHNDDVGTIKHEKIVVMFLDATWKYAQEMERANTKGNWWPKNIIRVKLSPPSQSKKMLDDGEQGVAPNTCSDPGETTATNFPIEYKPHRFNIRTPPSSGHLSTAECLAWVCAAIEDDPLIYETLMRPLDFMVERWKSFTAR